MVKPSAFPLEEGYLQATDIECCKSWVELCNAPGLKRADLYTRYEIVVQKNHLQSKMKSHFPNSGSGIVEMGWKYKVI